MTLPVPRVQGSGCRHSEATPGGCPEPGEERGHLSGVIGGGAVAVAGVLPVAPLEGGVRLTVEGELLPSPDHQQGVWRNVARLDR